MTEPDVCPSCGNDPDWGIPLHREDCERLGTCGQAGPPWQDPPWHPQPASRSGIYTKADQRHRTRDHHPGSTNPRKATVRLLHEIADQPPLIRTTRGLTRHLDNYTPRAVGIALDLLKKRGLIAKDDHPADSTRIYEGHAWHLTETGRAELAWMQARAEMIREDHQGGQR